jgi:uncharacterized protein YgiB involved in biofilm formation
MSSYANTRPSRAHFGLRGNDGTPSPAYAKALQGEAAKREGDNTKRTLVLTLAALGAGSAGLYFIANTGGPTIETPRIYTSVADCVAARIQPAASCEQQWNAANVVHQRGAPDYATMDACEKEHGRGKCTNPLTPDDAARSAKYIPMMSGYFFGKAPQGSFTGVPLYTLVREGPNSYRIAEIRPKEPQEAAEPQKAASEEKGNGGTSRSLLVIPAAAALAAARAPAAPAAPPNAVRPGVAPAPAPASGFAPVRAAPPAPGPNAAVAPASQKSSPAAAPASRSATSRGGMGSSARSASRSGS